MEQEQNQDNIPGILEQHPLKNQVILKQVIQFLQISAALEDWKNVRLVCKLWHGETLSVWRSIAVLNLIKETPILERPSAGKISAFVFLTELQNPESPYKLNEIPYRKYKFENLKIDLPFCEENALAKSFWTVVGPQMKHLILKHVNFITAEKSTVELLRFFIEKTPNLERLELNKVFKNGHTVSWPGNSIVDEVHPKLVSLNCTDFWGFRLSRFPNLQEVCFNNCDTMALILSISKNEDALCTTDQFVNSSVRRLDLMNTSIGYCPMISTRTKDVKFTRLGHLSLNVHSREDYLYGENDPTFLPTFLGNHCETLSILEIYTSCCRLPSEICPFSSVQFPVLTELRLWGNVVANLGFLKNMPNLTLLHIDLYNFEKKKKMTDEISYDCAGYPATKLYLLPDIIKVMGDAGNVAEFVLEKLEYFQINCPLGPESVAIVANWMPNLKTLKAVLDTKSLAMVCEKWPKLEKLECLFDSCILDEGVTGKGGLSEDKLNEALIDLKFLKSFHYNCICDQSSLTDYSVFQGFLKMRELTDLQICVSPEFTKEAEDALAARIQNVRVVRNYVSNQNHSNWNCCKDKMYKEYLFNYEPPTLSDIERSSNSEQDSDSDE